MQFSDVLNERRSLRTLGQFDVDPDLIRRLAEAAGLAPSCSNRQPWRYIFVYNSEKLAELFHTLAPGNYWAKKASLMIAVFSHKELDCVIKDREYYQFDTGMATAFLMLKATDLGLVAHPMAGFDPEAARQVLNVPDDMQLITLIAVGQKLDKVDPMLSEKHFQQEKERPIRKGIQDYIYHNEYSD